jgi:hypothetical protein
MGDELMVLVMTCDNCRKTPKNSSEAAEYLSIGQALGQVGFHSCSEPCDAELSKRLRREIRQAGAAAKLGIVGPNGTPPTDPALE